MTHRQNAEEGNFKVRCEEKGTCVYTHETHVQLTYEERELFNDVIDYLNTNEMLAKNKEKRRTIIYLSNELAKLQNAKQGVLGGAKGRTPGTSHSGRQS